MKIESGIKPVLSRRRVLAALLVASVAFSAALFAEGPSGYLISGLNITPGGSPSELNFAWFSSFAEETPEVQIVKKSNQKGDDFPIGFARTFTGTSRQVFATQSRADDAHRALDRYSEKVTVSDLSESTAYMYRVGDGKSWSDPYPISTQNPRDFGFLIAGDPQLGARSGGKKTLADDRAGWLDTVQKATDAYPSASFMISLGDEVNDYNKISVQDSEYEAYFSPPQLLSLPVATLDGNHDFAMGEYYGYHYNQPNLSPQYGASYGNDGDYWFIYGDAIFIMLNSNTASIATHDQFIREALSHNSSAKWRIVCFHHSIYSEAAGSDEPDILDRRTNYPAVFERYKIDIVLQGHNHSYTRSFPIVKGKPDTAGADSDSVVNPAGIVYFTFNSGSGNKYNDWRTEVPEVFSAKRWQGHVASFGYMSLSGDTATVSVYRTDNMSVIDKFSISKR